MRRVASDTEFSENPLDLIAEVANVEN